MAAQQSLTNDLATLLKLPSKVFDELIDKTNLCIGSAIAEARIVGEQSTVINIGIGQLSINLVDMQCKFTPSKNLKTTIKKCLTTKVDPLELALEQEVADRILAICKEAL